MNIYINCNQYGLIASDSSETQNKLIARLDIIEINKFIKITNWEHDQNTKNYLQARLKKLASYKISDKVLDSKIRHITALAEMLFSSNKKEFKTAFQKHPISQCQDDTLDAIEAISKCLEECIELAPWNSKNWHRKFISQQIKQMEKKKKCVQKKDKSLAKEVTKDIKKTWHNAKKSSKIFTKIRSETKTVNQQEIYTQRTSNEKIVLKKLKQWLKNSDYLLAATKNRCNAIDRMLAKKIKASNQLISGLVYEMTSDKEMSSDKKIKYYVASSDREYKDIHAICVTHTKKNAAQKIDLLFVNPDSLVNRTHGLPGGATCLLTHIGRHAIAKQRNRPICLGSTHSAETFYEKLGFQRVDRQDSNGRSFCMEPTRVKELRAETKKKYPNHKMIHYKK